MTPEVALLFLESMDSRRKKKTHNVLKKDAVRAIVAAYKQGQKDLAEAAMRDFGAKEAAE